VNLIKYTWQDFIDSVIGLSDIELTVFLQSRGTIANICWQPAQR